MMRYKCYALQTLQCHALLIRNKNRGFSKRKQGKNVGIWAKIDKSQDFPDEISLKDTKSTKNIKISLWTLCLCGRHFFLKTETTTATP